MTPQFTPKEIGTLLRRHESRQGCELCGRFHVLSYGGNYWCQDSRHHPMSLAPALEPMTQAEMEDLRQQIIREKNASYPGGYQAWCDHRGIPEHKR